MNLTCLLTGYESYLKKIYYLIHGEALKRPFDEGYHTLMDAIMAFPSIRALRRSPKQEHRLLFSEMNMLRNLRNEMRFSPHFLNEKQLGSALDIVTDMYIFIIAAEMSKINKSFNTIKGQ
jgi:type I restriction enzyme R subunit